MSQTGNGVLDKSKALCVGCRDNFYNGNNDKGIKECWLYARAKMVERFKIGWWTPPTSLDAFERVWTFECHNNPGQYAMEKELPAHLMKGVEQLPEHLRVAKVPA